MTVKKGDLLVPVTEHSRTIWGKGIVTEPRVLDFPPAHLAFWFSHGRETVIEQEILEGNFEVVSALEGAEELSSSPGASALSDS